MQTILPPSGNTIKIPTIQFFCWTRRPAHWTKQQPFDC